MLRGLGTLRNVATVQRVSIANHADTNEPIETWATHVSGLFCSIETVSGGEVRRGRQMQAGTTTLIRTHHPQGDFTITTADRISFDSRMLNIVASYDPTGRREEWWIECEENS
jgi:SPP1 family predicted phage head-tail adaptor